MDKDLNIVIKNRVVYEDPEEEIIKPGFEGEEEYLS